MRVSRTVTVSGVTTTTFYVGNYFEVAASGGVTTTTKYFYFGAQRVVMRTSAGVTYLHGDHLGSTNATSGANTGSQAYYPFGGVRAGSIATDYTFTGQKFDSYIKLMQMGARWYDADLGRFIQPDTIIPNQYNPQSLNRYAYALNNPLRYTDPSGHAGCGGVDGPDCGEGTSARKTSNGELDDSGSDISDDSFDGYVLILACGADTNCAGNKIPPGYRGLVPFSTLKGKFESLGGKVIYVPGNFDSLPSLADVKAMAAAIKQIVEDNAGAKGIFIAGHSEGAQGIVAALSDLDDKNILGVALLDPDLQDGIHALLGKRPDSIANGNVVIDKFKVFIGKDTARDAILSGFWGDLPTSTADTSRTYTGNVDPRHTGLAVDVGVANDIIDFFTKYLR